ncbi:hypothetical protein CRG98_006308 [Punica granatum]|uniref:Uncharacterized protein n=1 Tax=Punica granatum TaxID=22663 RepID=A0A2I0KYG3_PUNGR|nr:hypothetical protein CRG98_006308 [Punica granatum]
MESTGAVNGDDEVEAEITGLRDSPPMLLGFNNGGFRVLRVTNDGALSCPGGDEKHTGSRTYLHLRSLPVITLSSCSSGDVFVLQVDIDAADVAEIRRKEGRKEGETMMMMTRWKLIEVPESPIRLYN